MSLSISPVSGALGAVVEGIDLATAQSNELDDLVSVLDKWLVIYLPDQNLDRFQLSKLGQNYGPAFLHPIVDNGFDDCPDVLELIKEPEDTTIFGGEGWHGDATWRKPAGYVSILHGLEVPEVGGDTAFASTIVAFEALSSGLKEVLRELNAVHTYSWYEAYEHPVHSAIQPVVRQHAASGREGLYVNRVFTNRFENMSVEESAPLLKYLFDHMQRQEFTCRFRWNSGGVLMWDNRFTLHFPINDFSDVRRRMIRTTRLESI